MPLHFTAFHPAYKLRSLPPTPFRTLHHARQIARQAGIRHVYTGNAFDPEGQSTWCHQCGELLIGRSGYALSSWNLTIEGLCRFCHAPLPGQFEQRPGKWGSRRQPLPLSDFRP